MRSEDDASRLDDQLYDWACCYAGVRPKLMAPKDSKIKKGYDPRWRPDRYFSWFIYGLAAWYDGRPAGPDDNVLTDPLISRLLDVKTLVQTEGGVD